MCSIAENDHEFQNLLSSTFQMLTLQMYTTTPNFYAILGIGPRVHCMLSRQVLSTGLFISSPFLPIFMWKICLQAKYKQTQQPPYI